jgi:hypothetical protein
LDNLYLLARAKLIRSNPDLFFRFSQRFWLFGLACQIYKNYRKIKKSNYYKHQLNSKKLNYEPEEFDEIMKNLNLKKQRAMKFLIAQCCDFVTASKNSGLAGLLGLKFNDGIIGIMGTISAVI